MTEIVAIIMVFGMIIVVGIAPIVGAVLVARYFARSIRRKNELKAEIYSKALEKGVELPKDLFASEPKVKNPLRAFTKGVIWTSAGLGFALAVIISCIVGQQNAYYIAAFGAFPLMIGGGYFAIYFMGKKRQDEQAQ
ncbi:MAG: DUF6249 domain-containing protein [Prevotellaceae bacterium]|jgi:hypothetical protein|nr:DUF6249 domain-containing protein [Prevotellaceae bacterium]